MTLAEKFSLKNIWSKIILKLVPYVQLCFLVFQVCDPRNMT